MKNKKKEYYVYSIQLEQFFIFFNYSKIFKSGLNSNLVISKNKNFYFKLKNNPVFYFKKHQVLLKKKSGIFFDSGSGRNGIIEILIKDNLKKNLLKEYSSFLKRYYKREINQYETLSLKKKTNNYGELFAFYLSLKFIDLFRSDCYFIAGDSKLVLFYWSLNVFSDKLSLETIELCSKVFLLRKKLQKLGLLFFFIDGDDNPADLGFHVKKKKK